eukprot:COSAG06_NODE_412_length_16042_cov_52.419934_20_plen_71_part_00
MHDAHAQQTREKGAMALAQLALALLVSSAVSKQPPYVLDLLPAALPAQQAYRNATLSSCERYPTPACLSM